MIASPTNESKSVPPTPKPSRRRGPEGPRIEGGSTETRRLAAAILEVLAGARTPTQAAEALAVSLPRYYALEARALEGLVAACAPRPKGRRSGPEKTEAALRREIESLRREGDRHRALARAAQRAVSLPEPKPPAKGRRRRRPTVRALRAVEVLRSATPEVPTPPETGVT